MNKFVTTIQKHQTPERRKYLRVCDALAMRIEGAESTTITPLSTTLTHVVNLSVKGLSFTTDRKLVAGEQLRLTMRLGSDLTTVSIRGIVLSVQQKASKTGKKHFLARIAFDQVSEDTKRLLEQHIDRIRAITQRSSRAYTPVKTTMAS